MLLVSPGLCPQAFGRTKRRHFVFGLASSNPRGLRSKLGEREKTTEPAHKSSAMIAMPLRVQQYVNTTLGHWVILLVDEIVSHHLETMGNHCWLAFTRESSCQGFLGGAGFGPPTVSPTDQGGFYVLLHPVLRA